MLCKHLSASVGRPETCEIGWLENRLCRACFEQPETAVPPAKNWRSEEVYHEGREEHEGWNPNPT